MSATPGRSDTCPCGSGRRYQHCCGALDATHMPASAQTELRTASSEPAQSRAAWIRLRLQEAIAAARRGPLGQAGGACGPILDVEPENVAALSLSGEIALRRDDLGRALKRTRRSVELQPRNASLRCALGDALRAARQPLDAAAQFQRAWELAPDHPSASSRLIMTLMQECEVDRAITHMRSAMARD